ncbi:MAG: DUF2325 domain-containing protein [Clostridia bacterium]|nr:DUF2325 domain-containing protein [Clostridia bacterium]
MSIVVVGGHERMERKYKAICSEYGHQAKVYTHMPAKFEKIMGTPDAFVMFTKTVSHKMVKTAMKKAKKMNIPVVWSHNSSSVSLENSIKELEKLNQNKK